MDQSRAGQERKAGLGRHRVMVIGWDWEDWHGEQEHHQEPEA